MNKEEIIAKISGDTKILKENVSLIINSFLEIITNDSLSNSELTKIERNKKKTNRKNIWKSTRSFRLYKSCGIPKQDNVIYIVKNVNNKIQLEIKKSSDINKFSAKMGGDGGGASE